MNATTTTAPMLAARFAGIVGISIAIAIISMDAIATGKWTIEAIAMPFVIITTVIAGHNAWSAWGEGKIGSALGFALMFAIGTGTTLYSSAGRQAANAEGAILAAQSHNDRISRREAALETTKARLEAAEANVAKEVKTGCKKRCEDWKVEAKEAKAAVAAIETELAELGPPVPVSPKASSVARLVAWFGQDEAATKELLQLIEPFILTLWAELTSIVALGYGFPLHAPAQPRATGRKETPKAETKAITETVPEPAPARETVTETMETVAPIRFTRRAAETDIQAILARGETIPAQDVLKARWGVPKGTVSKWLGLFEERGIIQRETVGRCKTVSAR